MTVPHITFKVRRGTQQQILSSPMSVYEMAYATDSSMLFIVDAEGVRQVVGQALRAKLSSRPDPGIGGRFFYATDVEELFVDNISSWQSIAYIDEHDHTKHVGIIGLHSQLSGIGPDDHHSQVHSLLGTDHIVSGLHDGKILKAANSLEYNFDYLVQDDLPDIDLGQLVT